MSKVKILKQRNVSSIEKDEMQKMVPKVFKFFIIQCLGLGILKL